MNSRLCISRTMTGRLGALLTGGVDLWLNTPKRPYEASGTSGMKAALNGVPSLSVLDGWWIEGWNEGVTGWAISDHDDEIDEANSLYERLEQVILPLYYGQHDAWRRIMRSTIAINGPYFNTQRMLKQYVLKAYFPERRRRRPRCWRGSWRVSVAVSSGVETLRLVSRFGLRSAGCFSTIPRPSAEAVLNSTRSRDISFAAAFGIVNAIGLSRLLKS